MNYRRKGQGRPLQRKGTARNNTIRLPEQLESRDLLAHPTFEHEFDPTHDHGAGCSCGACHVKLVTDAHGSYYVEALGSVDLYGEEPELILAADISDEAAVVKASDDTLAEARTVDLNKVPALHSNPDADQKIYLDFNGQRITGTGWNDGNDGRTIYAPAYDIDGDPETFDETELSRIEKIWERVAEDFAPFDVDVTTESPPSRDFRAGNKAIRVMISTNVDDRTGNEWFEDAGGVAYIGSWRSRSDTPVWVFANNLGGGEKRVAEAASHEVGHAFGLAHDGAQGEEYFAGYGSGQVSWAPIMGAGYSRAVTQWSRGEYDGANNREDDMRKIASTQNDISYRADDHGNSRTRATRLELTDEEVEIDALIHRSSDRDYFVFEAGAGRLDLDVDGIRYGSNLDIKATLYDANGDVIEEFNRTRSLDVDVRVDLEPGEYFLRVEGVGYGDPDDGGYSQYASVGQYTISGTIPAAVAVSRPSLAIARARANAANAALEAERAQQAAEQDAEREHLESMVNAFLAAIEATEDEAQRLAFQTYLAATLQALG